MTRSVSSRRAPVSKPERAAVRAPRPEPASFVDVRPAVEGKFLEAGGERLWIKGVTYGTFAPNSRGEPFSEQAVAARDLEAMASTGINAVRTYTPPPRWLLGEAHRLGIRVLAGLPWEQHVTFLDSEARRRDIRSRMRHQVAELAGHPALLAFTIGNEIPASIVRWHGRHATEAFLEDLYRDVKAEDPEALVTYVNFPTTEYLELPFLDFLSFNVYLESRNRLEAYLARLQNVAGERPLVMAEVGLDSLRNGEMRQAEVLDWQIHSTFGSGCAGAFVFAWTDEWHRGGHEVEDWNFGLTTRERTPKPALYRVGRAFSSVPVADVTEWPRISVVVCTHNGAPTIEETLEALEALEYPDYEILVVNDGSTDATREVLARHDVRSIHTANHGLSAARNTGWEHATGEVVAYIDDDAYPDPHWLQFVARTLEEEEVAAVGGPNLVPADDPLVAQSVARSPGGPTHVLLTDREAEHIPGCNMAFRKEVLEEVGGFDTRFRAAGDDVDICWRLQDAGHRIGFHAGALVWHHRRSSVRRYLKQQAGYGKAEADLARKWPAKYNELGHIPWSGRVYEGPLAGGLLAPSRIYQGTWGLAPFQRLYRGDGGTLGALPTMPEWYLVIVSLALLALLGLKSAPFLLALPLLALALAVPATRAARAALSAELPDGTNTLPRRLAFRGLTGALHLLQPAARLWGRIRGGLSPLQSRNDSGWTWPRTRRFTLWSEEWSGPADWLNGLEEILDERRAPRRCGGDYDRWDLEVDGGILAGARLLMAVEEHGHGHQNLRFWIWPHFRRRAYVVGGLSALVSGTALLAGATAIGAFLVGVLALIAGTALREAGVAQASLESALAELGAGKET